MFVALLPLFMSCLPSSLAKTLLRTLQPCGSALPWKITYMPVSPHRIRGKIFWSSFPERGWWDDTKQLDHDTVWGQTQLAFLWEKQTIVNWVSKKQVLEGKLYSICGGEKQNSDSVSTARIFKNKQTRKQSKARLAMKGTCGFFFIIREAVCGSPLARMSSGRLNRAFMSWSVQDLIRPQRPSRAPYWFQSLSFKTTRKLWPLVPNHLWFSVDKGSGMARCTETPSFADVGISSPRTALLSSMGWWHIVSVGRGAGVPSHFPSQTAIWRHSWPKPAPDIMAAFLWAIHLCLLTTAQLRTEHLLESPQPLWKI